MNGKQAREFLESNGIVAVRQPIRGSQWNTACSDPFRFYLTARLCLRRAMNESKALTAGSWLHTAAEHYQRPDLYDKEVTHVNKRIRDVGRAVGMASETISTFIEREQYYQTTAKAWWKIVAGMKMPNGLTIESMYNPSSNFQIVTQEEKIRMSGEPFGARSDIVIQPDAIAVNKKMKTFWIVDWKSTGMSTVERLSLCPLEFACQLYCHTLDHLHRKDELPESLSSLKDSKFGGMIHVAYEKPTIKFGREDRPHRWVSDGKKTGVWATIIGAPNDQPGFRVKHMGSDRKWDYTAIYTDIDECLQKMHELTGKKPTKEYDEEPLLEIYLNRCSDWYYSRGQYAHLEHQRVTSPVVNCSFVTIEELKKPLWLNEFKNRVAVIDDLANRLPEPDLFPKHGNPVNFNKLPSADPYYPFYVSDIRDWPAILMDKGLIQNPRD